MNNLLSDDFKTELGIIKTWIESDIKNSTYSNNNSKITTANYQIYLQRFELPNKFSCNSLSPPKIVKSFIGGVGSSKKLAKMMKDYLFTVSL